MQSADGLTHFRWHERAGPEPKHPALHDLIVFPSEAIYKKVRSKHSTSQRRLGMANSLGLL